MAVTNIWNILNLRESPFFQDPLDPSTGGHYPVRLFVGRKREADHILRGLGGAPHSRHAVQGPPGVGKTTLVQYVKAAAAESGWLAESEAIPVTSAAPAVRIDRAVPPGTGCCRHRTGPMIAADPAY